MAVAPDLCADDRARRARRLSGGDADGEDPGQNRREGRCRCRGRQGRSRLAAGGWQGRRRSEEHTSELQSLMRISYAVFCLKKKNEVQKTHNKSNLSN